MVKAWSKVRPVDHELVLSTVGLLMRCYLGRRSLIDIADMHWNVKSLTLT